MIVACVLVVSGCANEAEESLDQQAVKPPPASKLNDLNRQPAVASAGRESALTEVDQRVLEWFDSLGFPELAELKLVRVARSWRLVGDDEPKQHLMLAFLLSDDDATFTVLTFDLTESRFTAQGAGEALLGTSSFEIVDLAQEAARYLEQLRGRQDNKPDLMRRFGRMLSERGELIVWARVCAARDHDQLAHELIAAAASIPDPQTGRPIPANGLIDALSEEFAHSTMWQHVLALGDPDVSRPELLGRFQQFVEHFPDSRHAARAKGTIEILQQMVQEDVEHAKQPVKPLDEMTTEERVAELIYQLRDQNGQQFSQPGWCNIFGDPRDGVFAQPGTGKSPASQLVAIGYDAVPQLIATIDDRRFTRSVEFHRSFYFSHHVLRVGHCAVAILEAISGQQFFERKYNNAVAGRNTKSQIESWWSAFQSKGEKQVLIDGTIAGNQSSPRQAQRLLDKFPDVALATIGQGVQNAKSSSTRSALLQVASQIPGEETTELILEEVVGGAALVSRVAAARLLLARKHPQAVASMISEWKKFAGADSATRKRWAAPGNYEHRDGVEQLILFLANSGHPTAIRALGDGLADLPVDHRLSVVSAFGRYQGEFGLSSSGAGLGLGFPYDPIEFTEEAEAAAEELLISSLADTSERWGMSGNWDGKSFSDPRVCDIAGHVLSARQPDKYQFDLNGNSRERDRQRLTMINLWRAEQGLPLLPLPQPIRVEPAQAAEVQPLLQRLIQAQSDVEQAEAVKEIEKLGLPALPEVQRRLKELNPDDAGHRLVESLATRLSVVVNKVTVLPSSIATEGQLKATIAGLTGQPLTSASIIDLLVATAEGPPQGATGIRIVADKYDDGTGVMMRLTFTEERIPKLGSQKGWDTLQGVSLGEQSLLNSSGFLSLSHAKSRDAYGQLSAALDQAIAARSDQPFKLRIALIQDE